MADTAIIPRVSPPSGGGIEGLPRRLIIGIFPCMIFRSKGKVFKMNTAIVSLTFFAIPVFAADIRGKVWLETYGRSNGATIYPQYNWNAKSSLGAAWGYGFLESTPHERLFANNLIVACPGKLPICFHAEIGGAPGIPAAFFQLGGQLDVVRLAPKIGGVVNHAFVAQLPKLAGPRPPSTLFSFGLKKFHVPCLGKTELHPETFYRAFPGGRPDYGETWLMFGHKRLPHILAGPHIIKSGSRWDIGVGFRVQ